MHTENSSGHIGEAHPPFLKICGCWSLDAMPIELIFLIICFINGNLTNTSSATPPEGKTAILYIAHLIILCTSTETPIYYKFMDKIFDLL